MQPPGLLVKPDANRPGCMPAIGHLLSSQAQNTPCIHNQAHEVKQNRSDSSQDAWKLPAAPPPVRVQAAKHLSSYSSRVGSGIDIGSNTRSTSSSFPNETTNDGIRPATGSPGSSSCTSNIEHITRSSAALQHQKCCCSSSSSSIVECNDATAHDNVVVRPILWPMQELAALLSQQPMALQAAFACTVAAAEETARQTAATQQHQSSLRLQEVHLEEERGQQQQCLRQSQQQQQHYSTVPISYLQQLLAAAVPDWGGADVSYAALQIRCHINVVANFGIDTPKNAAGLAAIHPAADAAAAATVDNSTKQHNGLTTTASCTRPSSSSNSSHDSAPLHPPVDLLYAELAATIIAAAATEAAAAVGHLPAEVQRLVVDVTQELCNNSAAKAALEAAWEAAWEAAAAPTAAGITAACASGATTTVQGSAKCLPVVVAVKLLCKHLIGPQGFSDIRLLGWLACLARQQHLAMQVAAAATLANSTATPVPKQEPRTEYAITAELDTAGMCEVLLQVVQGLAGTFAHDSCSSFLLISEQALGFQTTTKQLATELAACQPLSLQHLVMQESSFEGTMSPAVLSPRPIRRSRIVFNGSTPTCPDGGSSACSPLWHSNCAAHFQPVSQQSSVHCSPKYAERTPGMQQQQQQQQVATLRGQQECQQQQQQDQWQHFEQDEQLARLRAAQQQAWQAEMLLQYQPWEGAYSPVAAKSGHSTPHMLVFKWGSGSSTGGCDCMDATDVAGAHEGVGMGHLQRVINILRLSSRDATSSFGSESW